MSIDFFLFILFVIIPILAIYVGINFILDNIVVILLTILLVVIIFICLAKKPSMTIISLLCLCLIYFVMVTTENRNELNNSPVEISVASETSVIYDSRGSQYTIPLGAIVARHRSTFYCYYNDKCETIDFDSLFYPKNLILEQLDQITYKEYRNSKWWLDYADEAQECIATAEAEAKAQSELYAALDLHPFEQQYWVIFTEGSRGDRVELSTVDSAVNREDLQIIWTKKLVLNYNTNQADCNQFYLDTNGEWIPMGTYHRLSDNATTIIASNLDVYDKDGNLIVAKSSYSDLDWNLLNFG